MSSEALFLFIAALTALYWFMFYKFMKESGEMKDERGRRINQLASEKILIVVQMLLLVGILAVNAFPSMNPIKLLALIYVVAIFGHAALRYYYLRVM
ncbi:hypothetical protein E3E22_04345 [Thermococcus sp. MV5]|uniref:hypothetical protein n=1 Tax=Thermococcus sp. MV5 TaxID=1638272 RepID=UPI001439B730|nr:hypothetical protein [Thermococcus sp. MV5]NJE25862.1 hypothetical protein [Thermococcus sp. MV5]